MTASSPSPPTVRRVLIMGAGGRDFHDFNTVFRDDPGSFVVGFTAAQIPGIAERVYPASLAGPRYPQGIRIFPEAELAALITREAVDIVYFAYSDLSHLEVMHRASLVLAAGADFALLGPRQTMLHADRPVISVCAVRTGAGKSPVAQWLVQWLRERGHATAVLRHPMPYGNLQRQAVQRFATYADLAQAQATVEEREEYEPYLRLGVPVFAGVDYARILAAAQQEAQVILWDGGNNDFPFLKPDLHLVLVDPHRAGHELSYHPGEVNLRLADAVIVSKAGSASPAQLAEVTRNVARLRPGVPVVHGDLEITLEEGASLNGKTVAIVGDGPTLTHGGMSHGAGSLAARKYHAGEILDPRPYLTGSLKEAFVDYPHLAREIPALGYSATQLLELEQTIAGLPVEVVIDATPVDLARLIRIRQTVVEVSYRFVPREGGLQALLEQFERRHLSSPTG